MSTTTPDPEQPTTAHRLHTTTVGDGEQRLVFLHGLMGRGRNFATIARNLQDDCTSLLVDLPNHGASPWTETFDYVHMADRVADELRADFASHGPVAVLGHSMGGKTAMVLALRHPELVSDLIVEDVSPVDGGASAEFDHLLGSLLNLDLTAMTRRSEADEALREPIDSTMVRGFLLQNLRSGREGFSWEPNLTLLHRSLADIGGFPELTTPPFEKPVLWMGGEKSSYITDATVEPMRALFPSVRRVTVKGSGHWIHSEKPQEFTAVLRFFLEL